MRMGALYLVRLQGASFSNRHCATNSRFLIREFERHAGEARSSIC
jgi:hypothetical protein